MKISNKDVFAFEDVIFGAWNNSASLIVSSAEAHVFFVPWEEIINRFMSVDMKKRKDIEVWDMVF